MSLFQLLVVCFRSGSDYAFRDGDTVRIRVTEDEKRLDIQDNHEPDPTVAKPDSEVNPVETPQLTEEEKNQPM